jgi:hypothetical protein
MNLLTDGAGEGTGGGLRTSGNVTFHLKRSSKSDGQTSPNIKLHISSVDKVVFCNTVNPSSCQKENIISIKI